MVLRIVYGPKKESSEGKMAVNWEGPHRVMESLQNEAYRLKSIDGKKLPRT